MLPGYFDTCANSVYFPPTTPIKSLGMRLALVVRDVVAKTAIVILTIVLPVVLYYSIPNPQSKTVQKSQSAGWSYLSVLFMMHEYK